VKPFLDDVTPGQRQLGFMRTRITSTTREANDTFRGVSLGGKLCASRRMDVQVHRATQKMTVDVLTWNAAYDARLARYQDHGRAVQYADHVVRVSQGGGGLRIFRAPAQQKRVGKATTSSTRSCPRPTT
jgi:hypothetical protein